MRTSTTVLGLVATLAMVGVPGHAQAQVDELCLAQCEGVPGPQPKHPEWWDLSLTASQKETRWTGATSIYEKSTGGELASGRGIWDSSSQRIYLDFEVQADPTIDGEDKLVLVVPTEDVTQLPGWDHPNLLYIEFQPFPAGCPIGGPCANIGGQSIPIGDITYHVGTYTGTGYSWGPAVGSDPSGQWTVHNPWKERRGTTFGGGGPYTWHVKLALQAPVDIETGQVWSELDMYSNTLMAIDNGLTVDVTQFPLLCDPSLISNDCDMIGGPGLAAIPVLNTTDRWAHVTTGSISACEGVEVIPRLVGSDYGVVSGFVPGTSVPYDLPGNRISKANGSHLWAGFHNDTANTINPNDITVDFRIAEWGLNWATWDQASWSWVGSASLSALVGAGDYAGADAPSPLPGVLHSGLYVPPSTIVNDTQAMHVSLSTGAQINFKRDSAYAKMRLVRASVFRQPGDLSMAHRPVAQGQSTDVLLVVHTEAMPSVEECIVTGQTLRGCANGGPLLLDSPDKPKPKPGKVKPGQALPQQPLNEEPGQDLAGADSDPVGAQAEPQVLDIDHVDAKGAALEDLPRYTIHGLADTGETLTMPSMPVPAKVLTHFSSYGYYVEHEGAPSHGFEHYVHVPGGEPIPGLDSVIHVSLAAEEVLAVSNTIRVIDGVQEPCLAPPQVHEVMPKADEQALTQMLDAANKAGGLQDEVIIDPQFGCDAPANRGKCVEGQCAPHNPIGYIEGSRYVGEWTEAAVKAVYEPEAPDGLAASPVGDDELEEQEEALDTGLTDLPGTTEGCCAQASIEPQAKSRGAARMGALALLLLLLRRGRRRRRREQQAD